MATDLSTLGRLTRRRPVLRESLALAAICTADMVSTLYLIRARIATESNPLMVGSLAHSDAAFLALKGASFLFPIAVLELFRPLRPDFIVRALRACLVGYLALYAIGSAALLLVR